MEHGFSDLPITYWLYAQQLNEVLRIRMWAIVMPPEIPGEVYGKLLF